MVCNDKGEVISNAPPEVAQKDEEFIWKIENSMEDRYLVVEGRMGEEAFEEEMLLQNRISGLLPMETQWKDGAKVHRYCITGCRCIREELKGRKIAGEEYQRLFSEIFDCISRGKKYLLQEDSFWLSKESIFLHKETGVVEVCYVPEYQKSLVTQLRELSEWLLDYVDTNDKQAVYCGYAFHVLAHSDVCSFRGLTEVLQNGIEAEASESSPRILSYGEESDVHEAKPWVETEVIEAAHASHATGIREKTKKSRWKEVWSAIKGILFVMILVAVVFWAMN